ncbi:Crp/Fnr family transcriptional regulator [Lewinella cohaerens]|uniref:Crp/Fnr family transcriptional regulator n=1 Tax=Lewinella cohaerens TaxID=70995 RepID=UPI00036E3BD4|nr:Crp/Fnr family transcriptional regulator [Lewinella cohaerens]
MKEMKSFLSKIHAIEDDILDEYISYWTEYTVTKNTIMTWEGETEKYMYFVLEGIQKSYYTANGKEHIIAFTYPPSLSGIPESFLTQSPSKYFLKTITDSKFLRMPYEQHQELMTRNRSIETLFRKATEFLLIDTLNRYYELMAFDIETRFKNFTSRSPHLLQMVTQKDLASYLRMDSSNFSKLIGTIKI